MMASVVSVFSQNINVKGVVLDRDSITPMAFAYVVNRNSSTGTLSDEAGKFSLNVKLGDTLGFSYLGYSVTMVPTNLLKDSVRNFSLSIRVFLKPKINELKQVTIATHSFTKEEKEYYGRKADEYHRGVTSLFGMTPAGAGLSIDALYYAWSKKGKELQKLSALYRQLLVDEAKEQRLSPEKLRMITGDERLDVKEFLNYCYLPDQFVFYASDYDLYIAVKNYYKRYREIQERKR